VVVVVTRCIAPIKTDACNGDLSCLAFIYYLAQPAVATLLTKLVFLWTRYF